MRLRTSEWLELYVFTPGRRAWALRQLVAAARGEQALATLADTAEAAATADVALQLDLQAWEVAKADVRGREATARLVGADQTRDRALIGLFRDCQNKVGMEDAAVASAAGAILVQVFPGGVEQIIQKPFVEQTVTVEPLLARLQTGDLKDHVANAGVAGWVTTAAQRNQEFATLYADLGVDRAGRWDALKARDAAGQEAFADLIVDALAATRTNPALRTKLLGEVERQQTELREIYRRRQGRLADVDANTGRPSDPPPSDPPPSDPTPTA